jgi:hypothetical protein
MYISCIAYQHSIYTSEMIHMQNTDNKQILSTRQWFACFRRLCFIAMVTTQKTVIYFETQTHFRPNSPIGLISQIPHHMAHAYKLSSSCNGFQINNLIKLRQNCFNDSSFCTRNLMMIKRFYLKYPFLRI